MVAQMIWQRKNHFVTIAGLFFGVAIFIFTFSTNKAYATYDGARVIDNAVFLDSSTMSKTDIQNFLSSKGSGLSSKNYTLNCYGADSKERQWYTAVGAPCDSSVPASHIIYYAAQIYGINPRVILATLQKEQSLVTSPDPTSWQINQAMGYACPTSGQCNGSSNFFYQIDSGTWALRYHYERARGNMNWWLPSTTWVCGSEKNYYKPSLYPGITVRFYDQNGVNYRNYVLANAATSAMYCYTPHAYNNPEGLYGKPKFGTVGMYYSGSYNFVYWFENWFGSTRTTLQYGWRYIGQEVYSDANRTNLVRNIATAKPGTKLYARVYAQNIGTKTWSKSNTRLGTSSPRDRTSLFYDPTSWTGKTRAAVLKENSISPSSTGTFEFTLLAPQSSGSYIERFNLVVDGIAWMNDLGLYFFINVVTPKGNLPNTIVSSGDRILAGDHVLSADKMTSLKLSTSGRLELSSAFKKTWSNNVSGKIAKELRVQSDGNVVIYSKTGGVIWHSATYGNPGSRLEIQSNGNMVVYNSSEAVIWSSNTSVTPTFNAYVQNFVQKGTTLLPGQKMETANRKFNLVFQEDGNLVLYTKSSVIWSSKTYGEAVKSLVFQEDGNLVLYGRDGSVVWSTLTHKKAASTFTVQPDGNLVIYSVQNKPIWNSKGY